jgi:hypothetical protein
LGGTLGNLRGVFGSSGTSRDDGFSISGVIDGSPRELDNCRDAVGAFEDEGGTSAEGRDESAGVEGPGVCCSACACASVTPCDLVSF